MLSEIDEGLMSIDRAEANASEVMQNACIAKPFENLVVYLGKV